MDIMQMRAADIIVLREKDNFEVSLKLGVAERGASAKTGMR